jgi:hypothetical protein
MDISVPNPELVFVLATHRDGQCNLHGIGYIDLPGLMAESRQFHAEARSPEELAAFFDDFMHWMRTCRPMVEGYLEGATAVQLTWPF